MKTNKFYLARTAMMLLLALLISSVAWADNVTEEQALKQAQDFLKNHQTASGIQRRVSPTLLSGGQVSGLYVFNVANNGGFVIVSNDDRTIPILGYSDNGNIDPENMPSNMRAWLQGYADEIAWVKKQKAQNRRSSQSRAQRRTGTHATTPIGPLLSTTWDQDEPYCYNCPIVGYYCVTGCVATAMAQVMKYHQWPTSSTAIPNYLWNKYTSYKNDGNNYGPGELAATSFDWTHMANSYTGEESPTDASVVAVATLMRYCGQSVKMEYWTNESSASISDADEALTTYFGYEASTTQYLSRSYYSYEDWTDIIYYELDHHRPVLYGGASANGGHAFVCDGYKCVDGTDLFSINWGWGGKSNGFFVLSVLNPSEQGIGGSATNSAYNSGQEAIIGIQKTVEGDPVPVSTLVTSAKKNVDLTISNITLSQSTIAIGESVDVTVRVKNNSSDAYDGEICLTLGGFVSTGKMFEIASKATQDCVITFTPSSVGAHTLGAAFPTSDGLYQGPTELSATITVVDQTPTDLAATELGSTTATFSWTNVGNASKWNLRSRPVILEDFNGTVTDWDVFKWDESYKGDWGLSTSGGIGGSQCFVSPSYHNGEDLNPDVCLKTPQITLGGSISFYAWGEGEHFVVYISTNGTNFTSISREFEATNVATRYSINLSKYAGQTGWIVINHCNSGGHTSESFLHIDNFVFVDPSIEWTTVSNLQTNSCTVRNFSPESSYEAQVQTVNNDGGKWSGTLLFTTLAIPPSELAYNSISNNVALTWTNAASETAWNLRYRVRDNSSTTHNFNDAFSSSNLAVAGWQPTYWQTFDSDGDNNNWTVSTSDGRDGSKCFTSTGNSTTTANCLYTPLFTLGGSISFYVKGANENFWAYIVDENHKLIANVRGDTKATAEWTKYTVNLGAYIGSGRVVFVHDTSGTLLFDDVTIGEPGAWTTISATTKPYILTGLTANVTYCAQVQANFGNSVTSDWSNMLTFNTGVLVLANDDSSAETKNTTLIDEWDGIATNVKLNGRTLAGNDKWNTFCLPFDVNIATWTTLLKAITEQNVTVTAKVLNKSTTCLSDGGELTLAFTDATGTIAAGTPFIIKCNTETASLDLSDIPFPVTIDSSVDAITQMTQTSSDGNVKFIGQWSTFDITNDNINEIIYIGSGNQIGYSKAGRTLKCFRAHFWVQPNGTSAGARSINLDLGDGAATFINLVNADDASDTTTGWYSVDGTRLQDKPTKKGVYIYNNKKVIIK